MQFMVPPLLRQFQGRWQDYVFALLVWLCLFSAFVGFVIARTHEMIIASRQIEESETRLERRPFPELKLDMCELRERGSGGFSALPYTQVQMQESWHEFGDVMNTRMEVGRHERFAAPISLPRADFTMPLPEFELSEKQDETYKDAVMKCSRFQQGGQPSAPNDIVFYERRYEIRINLTASAVEESRRFDLLSDMSGVQVINGLFLRFSLAPDPLSNIASLDEFLVLRMLPFAFPGQALPKGNEAAPGVRSIKVTGQPNFHKWADTLGGRRGANESDTFTFKVNNVVDPDARGVKRLGAGGDVDPRTILSVNIDDATTVVHMHINHLYTNLMNYLSSLLAATSAFGVMSWLFVPVNESLRFPQRHFRFRCCGLGDQGRESDELDEDTPLLKNLEQGHEQGHKEGKAAQLSDKTDMS